MNEPVISDFDIHKTYNLLKGEQIVLSHFGRLDGDLVDMLIQLTDKKLSKSNTRIRVRKKIVNILVECLQNSLNYTADLDNSPEAESIAESPFLILSRQKNGYFIYTGNCITVEQADFLRSKIDELSTLNTEELHNYYLQTLNKETLPDSGGAGLGLADIMRRAKQNVAFEFYDLENGYFLFCLLIQVEAPDESLPTGTTPQTTQITEIKEI
ncbi:MAG: SiaB family protein kinase [Microscillaceae bacterium]|jgi:hypothetical protein|nr:SiaB family protein kinase [Microscillaceae bacterium]